MKYRNHPSIIAIQSKCKNKGSFNFIEVDQKQIEKEILNLDVKVLKENTDIFSNFLCNSFNNSIKLSAFPEILKYVDITPSYKKSNKDINGNHRPVSVLPNLSKIFEKCMFE